MKKIKYSGTYKVKSGDIFVYTDNGKSIIIERESRDKTLGKLIWTCVGSQFKWNKPEKIGGKLMFGIEPVDDQYIISDAARYGLHSDGQIYFGCFEFFPTKEAAQAVLNKFYPKPKHVWKHGDVFENVAGVWIYLEPYTGPIVVSFEENCGGAPECQLENAKFLFNIKEKI